MLDCDPLYRANLTFTLNLTVHHQYAADPMHPNLPPLAPELKESAGEGTTISSVRTALLHI